MINLDDNVLKLFPDVLCVEYAILPKEQISKSMVFYCKQQPDNEITASLAYLLRMKEVKYELIAQDDYEQFDQIIHSMARKAYSPIHPKMDGKCPTCNSSAVTDIVYGLPSDSSLNKALAGEVILGGCCDSRFSHKRGCLDCKYEWNWEDDVA